MVGVVNWTCWTPSVQSDKPEAPPVGTTLRTLKKKGHSEVFRCSLRNLKYSGLYLHGQSQFSFSCSWAGWVDKFIAKSSVVKTNLSLRIQASFSWTKGSWYKERASQTLDSNILFAASETTWLLRNIRCTASSARFKVRRAKCSMPIPKDFLRSIYGEVKQVKNFLYPWFSACGCGRGLFSFISWGVPDPKRGPVCSRFCGSQFCPQSMEDGLRGLDWARHNSLGRWAPGS